MASRKRKRRTDTAGPTRVRECDVRDETFLRTWEWLVEQSNTALPAAKELFTAWDAVRRTRVRTRVHRSGHKRERENAVLWLIESVFSTQSAKRDMSILFAAVALLDRYVIRCGRAITEGDLRLLTIVAFALAEKYEDEIYMKFPFSMCSAFGGVQAYVDMEAEFLRTLDFRMPASNVHAMCEWLWTWLSVRGLATLLVRNYMCGITMMTLPSSDMAMHAPENLATGVVLLAVRACGKLPYDDVASQLLAVTGVSVHATLCVMWSVIVSLKLHVASDLWSVPDRTLLSLAGIPHTRRHVLISPDTISYVRNAMNVYS